MTGPSILLIGLGLLISASATKCPRQKTSPGREVLCYTSTTDVDQLTDALCKCTTLVHQGYDVRNITTSDVEPVRKSLKEMYPALQFVVSVNDLTGTLKTSATMRQEISARLARVLKEVDGVELNVTAGSKERLYHFVKGLKDEMVRKSTDKRIFVALPTKSGDLAKQFDIKELSKYADLFTVATHYLVDNDEAYRTFHPSRLLGLFDMLNTDSIVDLMIGLGAPKRKILVSVPASGYEFILKNEDENAPRSPTEQKEPSVINRKKLCDSMNKGEWTIERDEDLTAPYAFKNKTWIAFEDKISAGIKGKYALLRDLAGLGIRDIENDLQSDCGKPLTHEIHHSFSDFKRKTRQAVLSSLEDDLHQSQISYPNHIKSSDYRVVRVVDTEGHIRAVRENTQTEFTCTRQGYFVHPRSCNRFYRCVKFNQGVEDYSVFEFDCPAGLSFDERTEVCVWPHTLPEGSPCPGSSEIAPVTRVRFECPSQPGYYADPQNGRWFFACIDLGGPQLMAYEFRCPFDLVFDEQKLACDWPWLVPGYEDSGYARTEYSGYGGGSTHGTAYTSVGTSDGYSGSSDGGFYGSGGSGYSGSTPGSTPGHSTSGKFDGYSGFSGPAGVALGGSGYPGSGSTTGKGYSGSTGAGVSGTGFSGSTQGRGYSGSSGIVYSGSTQGTGYPGSVTGGHTELTGSGYSGSTQGTGGSHTGIAGSGYSGSTAGSGYSGSTGSGYAGSTSGSKYSGSTGSGYAGSTAQSGYSGSTGSAYAGSTAGSGYSGSTGFGYTGSTTGSGYPGSSSSVYVGSTAGAHASSGTGLVGSSETYTGSSGGSHGFSGSTGGIYTGSSIGISPSGPTETGSKTPGGAFSSVPTGSTGGKYPGSTPGSIGSIGTKYTDTSAFAGSQGSTSHVYTGSSGFYTGQTDGGYTQSGVAVSGGSSGSGYSTGVGSPGISGPTHFGVGLSTGSIGYGGSGESSATPGGYSEFTVSTGPGFSVSSGPSGETKYTGSVGLGYSGQGSTGSVFGQSTGTIHTSGQTGSSSPQEPGYISSTSFTGGAGSGGTQYGKVPTIGSASTPGIRPSGGIDYTISGGTKETTEYRPIYSSAGITGSGFTGSSTLKGTDYATGGELHTVGSTGSVYGGISTHEQTPGVSISYVPSSPGVLTSGSTGAQSTGFVSDKGTVGIHGSFGTTGYTFDHGSTAGTLYTTHPSQTTYLGGTTGGFDTGSVGPSFGKGITTPGIESTRHRGFGGGFAQVPGRANLLNITILGQDGPSPGRTRYHGGYSTTGTTGTIVTGNSIDGSIVTGDSSSGTLFTHGDVSGSVLTGGSDQGTIVTGVSQPGYVKTDAGTPGYVVSDGVKTIYTGSASPGTISHGITAPGVAISGTPSSGAVLTGGSRPGTVLTGQTAPGVTLGGSIHPGTVTGGSTGTVYSAGSGSTGYHGSSLSGSTGPVYTGTPQIGRVPTSPTGSPSTGYQTNEYHDNGGRSTIKFNNGAVTNKYTEKDLPDYRPSIGTLPDSDISGGRVEGVSTVKPVTGGYSPGQSSAFTPSGFTKTGPTKTGITTASLGGRGSYAISTGPKPTLNPEHIGEKAFEGNVAGFTDSTKTSSSAGSSSSSDSGYSYTRPKIPFSTGGATSSTLAPISPTEGNVPFTATTPSPYLNVEIYNTPTSKTNVQYQGSTTGFSRGSSRFSTSAPTVLYTTGPLENYKTTMFDAAKIPVRVTTVQPVIDTGYKTIVSPTTIPVTLTRDQFYHGGSTQTGYTQTQSISSPGSSYLPTGFTSSKDHGSGPTPLPGVTISSGYATKSGPTYSVSTERPTVTSRPEVQYVPSSTISSISPQYTGPQYQQPTNVSEPQIQYLPSTTVSPTIGVTYTKPFPIPGVTYQPSTYRPSLSPSGSSRGYPYSQTSNISPGSPSSQGYPSTGTSFGPSTGGSPTNLGIPKTEVQKLITNYNRGTVKYVPSEYDVYTGTDHTQTTKTSFSTGYTGKQTSTSFSSSSGQTHVGSTSFQETQRPSVTTYTGGYTKVPTTSYELSTKQATTPSKGKIIVKWSDLHPLLLGKLGAQCTCKSDPFATLRGPGKNLIASNKGQVDLANYDESDVYVDLENDSDYNDDYVTTYGSSSPAPWKISNAETPVVALIGDTSSNNPQHNGEPSPTYLPGQKLSPSSNFGDSYSSGQRSAKHLNNGDSRKNSIGQRKPSYDDYESNGQDDADDVLLGVSDCARPGLFRHPNFCNKFYACHWDQWKKKFTLHVFNCPVHLSFDVNAGACNWPSKGPACQDNSLLV